MAKKLRQFRWYSNSEDETRNVPSASLENYHDGTVFDKVYPISQLGIQALPGTKFYLNGDVKPLIIGVSGIYDLDIKNGFRVTDLRFSEESLNLISNNPTSFLIVDILYGEEE